ncbi:YopX family protein [Lactiplantibacillus plantarum]|uniref:YopX family protein n=1 Tax=Lactiplantibacillus plantarum TaxID=1590 RepID=UPI0006C924F1|nr:YopX family protein [Lactiplantibacillus plantarum]QXD12430.1 YopX family protein [Lactiplantibacillus plantarum 2025]
MIKFRAWDNECKIIRDYDELKGLTLDALDASDFKLEQFTGLKDVNGKEIYEGDILENRKYRSIVKFASGKFLADVVGTISRFDLIGETHGSKVIGNVHENLELLEEEK